MTSDLSLKPTVVGLALVLRILLTSSHVIDPKTDAWYLFKKTADSQCRMIASMDYRKDTAACVSLSKSTMSKTLEPLERPDRLTPCRRRRRRFREPQTPCQPLFSEILQIQDQGLKTTKNHRKENQEAFLLTVRRFDWSAEPSETNR